MVDETGEMMLYDRYSIGVADLDKSKTYYVEGFLTVFRGILELYPIKITSGLVGDVNGDGEVNIADVNALTNIILGADADDAMMERADVNADGEVNIADVNALINIILG